jgi:iron complex transport system permease protein
MVDKNRIITSFSGQSSDAETEKKKYRKLVVKRIGFLVVCVVLLFVVAGVSLALGSASISFTEAYSAVFAKIFPGWLTVSTLADTVVWHLRLPRILVAIFAGAIFAMSGSTTQAILRNPLATPYTLGVSAGAGLGASIGIILGHGIFGENLIVVGNAFVFSLIPAIVILIMVKRRGAEPATIILSGVAIMYIFSACNTLLQYFAEANAVTATVFWLVGDLSRAAWWQLPYLLIVFGVCFAINIKLSWDLNLMKMGDDSAKSLGVEVDRVRKIVLIAACVSTATVVSFTGAIGFVCLLAPHICRSIIGADERFLVIASSLFGANLLLIADLVARRIIAPIMLPVGALTAFLGGPLLLYLLMKRKISY